VIGLKYGKFLEQDNEAKEKTYLLVQEFNRKFTERYKSTKCQELLGVNLLSGDKQIANRQVKLVCPAVVKDAVEILENIL